MAAALAEVEQEYALKNERISNVDQLLKRPQPLRARTWST